MNKIKIGLLTLGLMVAGVAGAAVLTVFVTSSDLVSVSQAVTFDNGDVIATNTASDTFGGSLENYSHELTNHANQVIPVVFVTTVLNGNGSAIANGEVVSVSYLLDDSSGTPVTSTANANLPANYTGTFTTVIDYADDISVATYTITTTVSPTVPAVPAA